MKIWFTKATAVPLCGAEQALKSWGIEYQKQPDSSLLVPGNLDISGKGLTQLPDLSRVSVRGGFYCHHNQLTSLQGAPQTVGGHFWCFYNQLASLEHAPATVRRDFWCSDNLLTSLQGAPHTVGGGFWCDHNQLTSLEHAPQKFKQLESDFGTFASWDAIPEALQVSPETKKRREVERLTAATVLQSSLQISRPLKLRSKAHSC